MEIDARPVVYTALFGHYEELKAPLVVTPGWRYVCFTDQPIASDVWEIKLVDIPYNIDPQKKARYFKLMEWVDWHRSMWVDASFIIATDLDLWWQNHFAKGLSAAAHPLRNDVYNECLDCIISQRGNKEQVQAQMAEYKEAGVPGNQGLIQSGILLRENTPEVIALCEAWWREVESHSNRDQIAFCKVAYGSPVVHTYQWDYRMANEFIYKKHFKNR